MGTVPTKLQEAAHTAKLWGVVRISGNARSKPRWKRENLAIISKIVEDIIQSGVKGNDVNRINDSMHQLYQSWTYYRSPGGGGGIPCFVSLKWGREWLPSLMMEMEELGDILCQLNGVFKIFSFHNLIPIHPDEATTNNCEKQDIISLIKCHIDLCMCI